MTLETEPKISDVPDTTTPVPTTDTPPAPSTFTKEDVDKQIAEAIKNMKDNLDRAYKERDDVKKTLTAREQQDEVDRLKAEGKLKEAHELEKAELKKQNEEANKRIVELTRDLDIKNGLSGHDFKNAKMLNFAFNEISGQLVQQEDGSWKNKAGLSVADLIDAFVKDPDNAPFFKVPAQTGSGLDTTPTTTTNTSGDSSLFKKTQAEVIQMAAAGKLPKSN